MAGIYYRLDKGISGGRNSRATDDTLNYHYRAAKALLAAEVDDDASPLYAALEFRPKLAAKWYALERRYYGLPQ